MDHRSVERRRNKSELDLLQGKEDVMPRRSLSQTERAAWMSRSARLNAGQEIAVGARVRDFLLIEGVVTRIAPSNPKNPRDEHGTVEVRLEDGEYEHFTHTQWRTQLRLLIPNETSPAVAGA